MTQLFSCLVPNNHLSAESLDRLSSWWQQLSPSQRTELHLYFDPRAEDLAFSSPSDDHLWELLPLTLGGVFIDEEDLLHRRLWSQDTFDYYDDDPRWFLHDNKYPHSNKAFEWRHYHWQCAPVY
jgi:hypothetical protein